MAEKQVRIENETNDGIDDGSNFRMYEWDGIDESAFATTELMVVEQLP